MKIPKRKQPWLGPIEHWMFLDRLQHYLSLHSASLDQAAFLALGLLPEKYAPPLTVVWFDTPLLPGDSDGWGGQNEDLWAWMEDLKAQWRAAGGEDQAVDLREFLAWVTAAYEEPHWLSIVREAGLLTRNATPRIGMSARVVHLEQSGLPSVPQVPEVQFKHWQQIRTLSLTEAAMLIAGVDPATGTSSEEARSRAFVFERAVLEAVQRAHHFAWEHARELERLMMNRRKNQAAIADASITPDIWETSDYWADFLPTIELRDNVAAIHENPQDQPVLLAIDPWYTATVYGAEMNRWLNRVGIDSRFYFADWQQVVVTARESNWYAQQGKLEPELRGNEPDTAQSVTAELGDAVAEEAGAVEKPLATRERNTLHATIGMLLEMVMGQFENKQEAFIAHVLEQNVSGMKKRQLEYLIPVAKKALEARRSRK